MMVSGMPTPEGGVAIALPMPIERRQKRSSWEDCDIPEEFPNSMGFERKLMPTWRDSEGSDTDVPENESYAPSPTDSNEGYPHLDAPSSWPEMDCDLPQKRNRGSTLDCFDIDDEIPDEWSVKNPNRCPNYNISPKSTMEGRAVEPRMSGEEDEYDPRNSRYVQPADTQQVTEWKARQLHQQIARLETILQVREKMEPSSSPAMQSYRRVLEEMRRDFADLGVQLLDTTQKEPKKHRRGGFPRRHKTVDDLEPLEELPPAPAMDAYILDRKSTW